MDEHLLFESNTKTLKRHKNSTFILGMVVTALEKKMNLQVADILLVKMNLPQMNPQLCQPQLYQPQPPRLPQQNQ